MDWRAFINSLNSCSDSKFEFNLPATKDELLTLQEKFKLSELPEELLELYTQTDGIEEYLDNYNIGELIWSIERVIETNLEFRTYSDFKDLYMSFDQLLFVSDAGNGDLFGFVTINGNFDRNDIFVWNHENDSCTWIAPDLKTFLEGWMNGSISV